LSWLIASIPLVLGERRQGSSGKNNIHHSKAVKGGSMKVLFHLLIVLLLSWPDWALAEEAPHAGYRGIASIYYTLIWGILAYGLWDAFGKKAFYVGGPVIAVIIYFLLPST
jgi:hypothetical protein